MVIKSIALAVSTLVLSSAVNAAIVSVNWQSAGDNLITYDTVNGLDWLDLTVTTNRSYNDISSQFGVGGEFEGWRYATSAEVSGFFDAFGGDNDFYNGWSTENNGLFDLIAPYWGDALCSLQACSPGDGDSLFVTAEASGQDAHNIGRITDLIGDPMSVTDDLIYLSAGSFGDLSVNSKVGAALVRVSTVPIPAAAWLFGSGLIGLIGVARRKKA